MNNKGFSLIEVIAVIAIIALVFIVVIRVSGNTMSINNEEAYKLTKKSIIEACDKYILECNNNIIDCDLVWFNNKTNIMASDLINAGYFKDLINPINGNKLDNCLYVEVMRINNNYSYKINENDC